MMFILITTLMLLFLAKTKAFYQHTQYVFRHNRLKEEALRYQDSALVPPYVLFYYNLRHPRFYQPKKEFPYNDQFKRELGFYFRDFLLEDKKPKCFQPEKPTSYFRLMFPLLQKEFVLYLAIPFSLGLFACFANDTARIFLVLLAVMLLTRGCILIYHLVYHHPLRIKRKIEQLPAVTYASKKALRTAYFQKNNRLKKMS